MRELSLFSGAGGGLLASKYLLGWRTIGYVEWDDYCQRVLAQRIKDGLLDEAPIFGDIRSFIRDGYAERYRGMVDVVTGGFPCQDISCAGRGVGIKGERSGLWKEMASVVRIVRPRYVFVENSPMLTIRGLGTVLGDLAEMGFDAKWCVLSASQIGAPHIRERIWILAYANGNRFQNKARKKQGRSTLDRHLLARWGGEFPIKRLGDGLRSIIDIERLYSPDLARVDDGASDQLDRLKCIGNMQHPQVVAEAWRILNE